MVRTSVMGLFVKRDWSFVVHLKGAGCTLPQRKGSECIVFKTSINGGLPSIAL